VWGRCILTSTVVTLCLLVSYVAEAMTAVALSSGMSSSGECPGASEEGFLWKKLELAHVVLSSLFVGCGCLLISFR